MLGKNCISVIFIAGMNEHHCLMDWMRGGQITLGDMSAASCFTKGQERQPN